MNLTQLCPPRAFIMMTWVVRPPLPEPPGFPAGTDN